MTKDLYKLYLLEKINQASTVKEFIILHKQIFKTPYLDNKTKTNLINYIRDRGQKMLQIG